MSKTKMRAGIAGAGFSASFHLEAARRIHGADVEVVGIAESDPVVIEKYRMKYGFSIDMVYGSVAELIDATHPDAVVRRTTPFLSTVRSSRRLHSMACM